MGSMGSRDSINPYFVNEVHYTFLAGALSNPGQDKNIILFFGDRSIVRGDSKRFCL